MISDNLLVQAISRKDFKLRFPKGFHEYVKNMHNQKKIYRENAIEKSKTTSIMKEDSYNKQDVYNLNDNLINTLIAKPAIPALSRGFRRSNNTTRNDDYMFENPKVSSRPKNSLYSPKGLRTAINFFEK